VRFADDLDRSQQMFIAILGHDLRTPLGAIMMSASALLMSEGFSQSHQAMASRILNSGTRIKGMVNDLLDFARTRLGGGIPLVLGPLDLSEVCRQTVDELAAYHPNRDLRFEANGRPEGSWDGARIGQAISNLVGNAIEHGDACAPVTVIARGAADEATVTVHNQGGPIAPDRIHHIFSPMTRLDPDARRSSASGSLGLGLYIAHEIVKGHRGRIDVESSAERGTTFMIHLPTRSPGLH
jgi:signal transduction histidine kinase